MKDREAIIDRALATLEGQATLAKYYRNPPKVLYFIVK